MPRGNPGLKIASLEMHLDLPGANELSTHL